MNRSNLIPDHGAPEACFEQLVGLFSSSGFHLDAIRQRLGIGRLAELDPLRVRFKDYGPPRNSGQALIHLLVEGKPIPRPELAALVGADAVDLFERLNLIFPLNDSHVSATVALYPIEHIYIASDRYNSADEAQFEGFDEIVYPCLFETTARFLRMLNRSTCGTVLDLCSGTGVAGLLLAGTSQHTWAADITERSKLFALFNQRMNRIRNTTVVVGDLYEPVTGLTFDRIAVHPPYQPVYRHQQIFNSGGLDGEQISRRCIEESYAHLNPGGRLYCVAQITARHEPVDQRVRQWLSDKGAAGCDVGFYITKRHEIELFAAKATLNTGCTQRDYLEWMRQFALLGVRSLDYGLLIVERHAAPREPFTISRKTPEVWNPADFESSFAWEVDRRSNPDFESRLWNRRLVTISGTRMEVEHTLAEGSWHLGNYRIIQNGPFDVKIQASQGLAHLLALMDGERTVEQCFEEIAKAGAALDRRTFADTVIAMVSEGFLKVRG